MPSVFFPMLILCGTFWGCSHAEDPSPFERTSKERAPALPEASGAESSSQQMQARDREAEAVVSSRPLHRPVVLAERLRKVHEEADAARSQKEKSLSAERLLSLYEATGAESSPHFLSVRQDLAARAAQLLLEESPSRAKESAERGLSLSNAPSVVRANLLLALADAEEALRNPSKAKRALVEALVINEELFQSEMEAP